MFDECDFLTQALSRVCADMAVKVVPPEREMLKSPTDTHYVYDDGFNACRADILERINRYTKGV